MALFGNRNTIREMKEEEEARKEKLVSLTSEELSLIEDCLNFKVTSYRLAPRLAHQTDEDVEKAKAWIDRFANRIAKIITKIK